MSDGVPVLDVRTYQLVAGGGAEFHELASERAVPMLARHGIRVVAYGPSAENDDVYFLIRAFASAEERQEQLGAFYGSEEWRREHASAVEALLLAYHVVLVELTDDVTRRFAAVTKSGA